MMQRLASPFRLRSAPTPGEVLVQAADILEQRGWCRGDLETADGRVCAVGALRLAAQHGLKSPSMDTELKGRRLRAFRDALLEAEAEVAMCIAEWNDGQRDRRKVVRLLRRTARRLEAGQ